MRYAWSKVHAASTVNHIPQDPRLLWSRHQFGTISHYEHTHRRRFFTYMTMYTVLHTEKFNACRMRKKFHFHQSDLCAQWCSYGCRLPLIPYGHQRVHITASVEINFLFACGSCNTLHYIFLCVVPNNVIMRAMQMLYAWRYSQLNRFRVIKYKKKKN